MSDNHRVGVGEGLFYLTVIGIFIYWFYNSRRTFLKVFLFDALIILNTVRLMTEGTTSGAPFEGESMVAYFIVWVPVVLYTTFVWRGRSFTRVSDGNATPVR